MIPQAFVLKTVKAVEEGDFLFRDLYVIEDRAGVYRRITRNGDGLTKTREDSILCHTESTIVELVLWSEFADDCRQSRYIKNGENFVGKFMQWVGRIPQPTEKSDSAPQPVPESPAVPA